MYFDVDVYWVEVGIIGDVRVKFASCVTLFS
jgi:hypothetical protein